MVDSSGNDIKFREYKIFWSEILCRIFVDSYIFWCILTKILFDIFSKDIVLVNVEHRHLWEENINIWEYGLQNLELNFNALPCCEENTICSYIMHLSSTACMFLIIIASNLGCRFVTEANCWSVLFGWMSLQLSLEWVKPLYGCVQRTLPGVWQGGPLPPDVRQAVCFE